MEIMTSPYKNAADSPSRQLLYELSRLGISNQENFYARLDRESKEREAVHREALAAAAAEHDRIRRNAENEREKLELQLQAEQRRREEEERKELEKIRQERAEREIAEKRREIERAKTAELEARRLDEARRAAAAAASAAKADKERRDAEAAETARQLKEAQDARAREKDEAKHAEKRAKDAALLAQKKANEQLDLQNSQASLAAQPIRKPTRNPQREAEHQRYVEIHQNLKKLRKFMMAEAQKQPAFKQRMGDLRREIKKCVGQLIEGKGVNKVPLSQLMAVFREAAQVPEPRVDVSLFLASRPQQADTQAPALLLYLLNILAKAVVSQFIDEGGVSPKSADPVGIVASHIFSIGEFRWQGLSLIDILIAKMHVVCPVIWGIYGDESTTEGKLRIGWWQEEKNTNSPTWVSSQEHNQRMTGLGAGFAALAMRNYEKAKLDNPYPNVHYWKALAAIINVPPAEITQTHFVVLKAMIENYETRFLEFYGDAALAVLRVALLEFPSRGQQQSVAAKALAGLADVFRLTKKLNL